MRQDPPKHTPLYSRHVALGARMADFNGWEMPLWYPSGAVAENRAVVASAGLFDTSHMSVLTVSGPDALQLLQLCFTRDLEACQGKKKAPLDIGNCIYGAFLNDRGETIDDAVVYRFDPESYMVVVNASMGGEISRHLASNAGRWNVAIEDLSRIVGKLDLQGPNSGRILMEVLHDSAGVLTDMRYFTFKGRLNGASPRDDVALNDGTPIVLSRTGYTGEFGFEIFVGPEDVTRTWDLIVSAGQKFGLIPCGLAARDALRAGAVLPLSHQDIGPWPFINNPWEFALPFNEDRTGFTKRFIGEVVLSKRHTAEHTHAFVGRDPRKVSVHDPAVVLDSGAHEIGTVLTCVADMAIGRYRDRIYGIAGTDKPEGFNPGGLVCGFVKVGTRLHTGDVVRLRDQRRKIEVTITDDIRPDRTARRSMREMLA